MKPSQSGVQKSSSQPTDWPARTVVGSQAEAQNCTPWLGEVFEQSPEAAAIVGMDGRTLRINKEFTRMFGYTPDEVWQRPIDDLIVPEALVESAREDARRVTQGGRLEIETVRRRKDGSEFYVSLLAVAVTRTSGELVNYALYRDVTRAETG